MKMLTGVGNATVVIAFAASMTGLFFTSDEDWVEAVEVTVYTEDLVFIIRQEYTENAEEKAPFDGRTGMKILSRVDDTSSSLKMVNWDELKGMNIGVDDKESEEVSAGSTSGAVDIPEPMQSEIEGDIKNEEDIISSKYSSIHVIICM